MKLDEMKGSRIFALVAAQPWIRAVQIADAVDSGIEEVEDELLPHVNRGHIVKKEVLAPNQRYATGYAFSEDFMKTAVYAAIVGSNAARGLATAIPAPILAPALATEAPTPAPAPSPPAEASARLSPADDPSLRRIERAIAHIKEHGPTKEADLQQALNLRAGQYASNYLRRAVDDGRLAKNGRLWILGDGRPPAPVRKQPAFGGSLVLPGSTPNGAASRNGIPAGTLAKAVERPATTVADAAPSYLGSDMEREIKPAVEETAMPPLFRCGHWSDGVVELQRSGQQLAVLTMDECRIIARMVERESA